MHVIQLLDPLFLTPHIEFVEAGLPECPARRIAKELALSGIVARSFGQKGTGRALFEHLHGRRKAAHFRRAEQKKNVFGHDDVAHDHEAVL